MTLRRYERYKDSGVEWLGAVPAHWEVQPIKRLLLSVEQGWSPQCENFPAESGQWGVLKVGCVNGGRFNADENKALPVDLEPLPELGIRRGDVLVSRANTRELVGSVAVADRDYAQLLLCDKLYRLRVMPDRCEPSFLAHFIGSAAARSVIEAAATGASSSMLNIAQGAVVGMSMALPPVDEQRALLRFLDAETAKIDTLIAEQQRLIELLTEKRQAVIAHAVTKGLNLSAPMKDSGVEWLGEVPAHWRVQPFKHVADFRSGGTPDKSNLDFWDGAVPWASAKDLKVDDLFDTADHITDEALAAGAASLVPVNSVLVVVRGMILARTFPVVTARVPMAINQDLKAVAPRAPMDGEYLAWLLRASAADSLSRLDEAGHGTKALRMDAWGAMRVPLPPLAEQQQVATHLKHACSMADAGLSDVQHGIALLRERRTALISAAVTGQIDVRQPSPAQSTAAAHLQPHD